MSLTPARRAVAVVAGAGTVLLLGLLTYLTTLRGRDAAVWVAHTYEVLATLEATRGRAVDAETGVRGYVATGVARFLEPYVRADRDVARELARLRRLTADNPSQQLRLDTLEARAGAVVAQLDSAVALTRARPRERTEATALLATGKARMDALRAAAAAVGSEEQRLLAAREAEETRLRATTGWVVFGETLAAASCVVVVGLLLAAAARANERHAAAERAARTEAEDAAMRLQDQATELEVLTQELQAQATALEERTDEAERQRGDAERHREAAERANSARADFLASMSHELRTPLNAIQGYVALLADGLYGPVAEAQREPLERIRRAQTRLLALVTDVLNFTRLEEGRVTFDLRPTRVSDVVRDVLPLVEPQAHAKGLVLEVRLPAAPAAPAAEPSPDEGFALRDVSPVWADRAKLGQVLLNLLANAIKFTPARQPDGTPGVVRVEFTGRAEASAGEVLVGETPAGQAPTGADPTLAYLRVRDTGVGIPRDQQDAVFEPFVQVSTGLTRTSEGIGLGLAISRDLARGMGGDLRVRSREGTGSTFTVTLRRVVDVAGDDDPRRNTTS